VLIAGRKVVGSAQLRERDAVLQHGAVLLEDDQRLVHELAGPVPDLLPDVPLSEALGRRIGFEEMAEAVVAAAEPWGPWNRLDHEAIAAAAERHCAHFQDPAWTWAR
jgi:lipoate-protein ligase A